MAPKCPMKSYLCITPIICLFSLFCYVHLSRTRSMLTQEGLAQSSNKVSLHSLSTDVLKCLYMACRLDKGTIERGCDVKQHNKNWFGLLFHAGYLISYNIIFIWKNNCWNSRKKNAMLFLHKPVEKYSFLFWKCASRAKRMPLKTIKLFTLLFEVLQQLNSSRPYHDFEEGQKSYWINWNFYAME